MLVAKQLRGGVECILGIHRDPVFGPVAMFGLGGIFVEVLQDVVFRRCPFGDDVAATMIRSIRGCPLLTGARGRPKADVRGAGGDAGAAVGLRGRGGAAAARRSISIRCSRCRRAHGAFAADAVIEVG